LVEQLAGNCPDFYRRSAGTPLYQARLVDRELSGRETLPPIVIERRIDELAARLPFVVEMTGLMGKEIIAASNSASIAIAVFKKAVQLHLDRVLECDTGARVIRWHDPFKAAALVLRRK
jgi:hypothetical protein